MTMELGLRYQDDQEHRGCHPEDGRKRGADQVPLAEVSRPAANRDPVYKAGAEVRFSSCLVVHNIRFSIVDERIVVLGIPESVGEKEATKNGYRIPSEGLAPVLKNYFNTCEKQASLKEYLH